MPLLCELYSIPSSMYFQFKLLVGNANDFNLMLSLTLQYLLFSQLLQWGMVPQAGLEPARVVPRIVLKTTVFTIFTTAANEAGAGFEPA